MNLKTIVKNNVWNFLLIGLLLLMLFSPHAKAWLLNKLLYTGIFNANTQKENTIGLTPELTFINQQGNQISLRQLKGKTIFINFWATWCPPCMAEMPTINALHNQLKSDTNIVFLIIDMDNDFSKSATFMKKNKFDLPVFISTGSIPPEIMNGTLPTTIVINKQGNVIKKLEGLTNYNTNGMLNFLKKN